ncbi:hypothetical protein [uncultured Methanobrevibacter sp.]|uniref:hypothetical protein n=1 Tax=uncultured Methanobrevibacter sp. TaxID=253161 RepID=UPI002626B5A3|nr:hypothetical protein [uncultured Methanobrevibacter sp.]
MNKEEKYPQIQLHPNGDYHLFIEPGVELQFHDVKSIEDYIKNKNITIKPMYEPSYQFTKVKNRFPQHPKKDFKYRQ